MSGDLARSLRVAVGAAFLCLGAAVCAQPEGMMDPLYEHRCNRVVDPAVAAAGKTALRTRLIQADSYYTRSTEFARAGDAQAALREMLAFRQVISTLVAPTHHVYVEAELRSVALWVELRDYSKAMEEVNDVIRVWSDCLGPDDPFTIGALSAKGQLFEKMGRAKDALSISEDILERVQRRTAGLAPDVAKTAGERKRLIIAYANVAALAYRVDDYPRAKAGAIQTVQAANELADNDLDRYELLNSAWYCLNRIAYFTHDDAGQRQSIQGLRQSYFAMRDLLGEGHRRSLPALANLGFAVADVSAKDAVPILEEYVVMVESERVRAPLPDDRRIALEGKAGTYARFAFAAHAAMKTEEAFWGMEWSKSRSLRDDVSLKVALADTSIAQSDRAALAASEAKLTQLEVAIEGLQADKANRDAAILSLLEEKKRYEQLFAVAERRNPALRLASLSKIQRPDNAPQVLSQDEVFISYLVRRENGPMMEVMISVLEPSGKLSVVGPVQVWGLESSAASFVTVLSRSGGLNAVASSGQELWSVNGAYFFAAAARAQPPEAKSVYTVEPLRQMLSEKLLPEPIRAVVSKYKRWIVSPSGVLWSLPYEALREGAGLVLDTHVVRYSHSWSMLTLLAERSKSRPTAPVVLIAIGGATYSDRALPSGARDNAFPKWQDLKYSADELDRVAKSFSLVEGTTLFRGGRATRQTVADLQASGALARAKTILFSSHGSLNLENPLASAIVLGRPPSGTEADRYLSARAISRLTLNADVVVVSSCDSGRGRVASGEGVLGLPYAFFAAGASSTILTLWEIYDDAATADLVGKMMGGLQSGLAADEALTVAKRSVRKTADEASWAPFMLVGR